MRRSDRSETGGDRSTVVLIGLGASNQTEVVQDHDDGGRQEEGEQCRPGQPEGKTDHDRAEKLRLGGLFEQQGPTGTTADIDQQRARAISASMTISRPKAIDGTRQRAGSRASAGSNDPACCNRGQSGRCRANKTSRKIRYLIRSGGRPRTRSRASWPEHAKNVSISLCTPDHGHLQKNRPEVAATGRNL